MPKRGKKHHIDSDVYSKTLERFEYLYDRFDRVIVSFSGGKDSTACVECAREVATAKKRLPVEVVSFDEEAIPPETVEYMQRVSDCDDIKFSWYCIPIKHRNACSSIQPYWYCWLPEERDIWVRELPGRAITEPFTKKPVGIADLLEKMYDPALGTVANVMGIRTEESLTRYHSVASKRGENAYIMAAKPKTKYVQNCYPIYDWSTHDVWLAPNMLGWDYNRAYEVMSRAGVPFSAQRCCPPFGEQPLEGLWKFKVCWPDLWSKMINRVHGARTAARYAQTELYGKRVASDDKPEGMTWRDLTFATIEGLNEQSRSEVSASIRKLIYQHASRSSAAMPDAEPDPKSGFCWRFVYTVAKVGGDKFGRQSQKVAARALQARRKNGILS